MSHQLVTHFSAEPSGRSASAKTVHARLFGVDVQRPKRIDRQIDYFGSGGVLHPVVNPDSRGDSSLDAALRRLLHVVLHVVKGAGGGRRPVIGF
jgi:hypothetical protein